MSTYKELMEVVLNNMSLLGPKRESQLRIIKCIAGFVDKGLPFTFGAEAGTGVGKTYAYLIPLLVKKYSRQLHQKDFISLDEISLSRFVVSTSKITLQKQLIQKDLPAIIDFLSKIFPDFKATFVLAKGRRNYVCLREFNKEKIKFPKVFESWVTKTETGDFTELHEYLELHFENKAKEQIKSGSFASVFDLSLENADDFIYGKEEELNKLNCEDCLYRRCSYYTSCFFNKLTVLRTTSDVIVSNHHSTFINNYYGGICKFGFYESLVIDEAHEYQEAIRSVISNSLFYHRGKVEMVIKWMREKLYKDTSNKDPFNFIKELNTISDTYVELFDEVIGRMYEVTVIRNKNNIIFNYDELTDVDHLKLQLKNQLTNMEEHIKDLLKKEDDDWDSYEIREYEDTLIPVKYKFDKLKNSLIWLTQKNNNLQFYVDVGQEHIIKGIPIALKEYVDTGFVPKNWIFSSATMSDYKRSYKPNVSNRSMRRFVRNLGKSFDQVAVFESPFNYEENSLLYVDRYINWEYNENDSEYESSVINLSVDRIVEISQVVDGGILILCTSNKVMKALYNRSLNFISERNLYLQTTSNKNSSILNNFRKDESSILFGLKSFWEGVDVPGKALSCVIIPKLSFNVMDSPYYVGIRKQYYGIRTKITGDWPPPMQDFFNNEYVFDMILPLIQGSGRLIRSINDRGLVAILDNRLYTTKYGRTVRNAIKEYFPGIKSISTIEEASSFFME